MSLVILMKNIINQVLVKAGIRILIILPGGYRLFGYGYQPKIQYSQSDDHQLDQ